MELLVASKSVKELLSKGGKYIVPDYQRRYSWNIDECEVLWDDIVSAFEDEENSNQQYYLGTIVVYKENDKTKHNRMVIDGQQRLTTLLLLLRAFYAKFENYTASGDDREEIEGMMRHIRPCIWEVHEMRGTVNDKKNTRLVSKVITSDDEFALFSILEKGEKTQGETAYEKNYSFISDRCDEYARKSPVHWKKLCLFILNNCILLPIECDNMEKALQIFTTLNDRGLQLSDADIFKARIYEKQRTQRARNAFIAKWKQLEQGVDPQDEINIEMLFRFYFHYLRGKKGITKKENALRKFYFDNRIFDRRNTVIMDDLLNLQSFWKDILSLSQNELISQESVRYLHCLKYYPNEYWRYVLSVFFLTSGVNLESSNRDKRTFQKSLTNFLSQLTGFFYVKFILNPTVSAVKDDVYKINSNLCKNNKYKICIKDQSALRTVKKAIEEDDLPPKIERGLLLLYSYLTYSRGTHIPATFQIEHIFPTKWQLTSYNGWTEEDAMEYHQNIGNKMVIEKRVNIEASNGYFGKKKTAYANSKIAEVKALSRSRKTDWVKSDVINRKAAIKRKLMVFFQRIKVFSD